MRSSTELLSKGLLWVRAIGSMTAEVQQYPGLNVSSGEYLLGLGVYAYMLLRSCAEVRNCRHRGYHGPRGGDQHDGMLCFLDIPVCPLNKLQGYADLQQTDTGLHMRQRSRAWIVADPAEPTSRVVFINAGTSSMRHTTSYSSEKLLRAFVPSGNPHALRMTSIYAANMLCFSVFGGRKRMFVTYMLQT